MRHRFVNHARNVWDRAVSLLPRVDQLWYKYVHMEEMLGNVAGARQVRGLSLGSCLGAVRSPAWGARQGCLWGGRDLTWQQRPAWRASWAVALYRALADAPCPLTPAAGV